MASCRPVAPRGRGGPRALPPPSTRLRPVIEPQPSAGAARSVLSCGVLNARLTRGGASPPTVGTPATRGLAAVRARGCADRPRVSRPGPATPLERPPVRRPARRVRLVGNVARPEERAGPLPSRSRVRGSGCASWPPHAGQPRSRAFAIAGAVHVGGGDSPRTADRAPLWVLLTVAIVSSPTSARVHPGPAARRDAPRVLLGSAC